MKLREFFCVDEAPMFSVGQQASRSKKMLPLDPREVDALVSFLERHGNEVVNGVRMSDLEKRLYTLKVQKESPFLGGDASDGYQEEGEAEVQESVEKIGDFVVSNKMTTHGKSFSLTHEDYTALLDAAQRGKAEINVKSKIDGKHIATLDSRDVVISLLKMKPSLQVVGDDQYWVCNIPAQSFKKRPQHGAHATRMGDD